MTKIRLGNSWLLCHSLDQRQAALGGSNQESSSCSRVQKEEYGKCERLSERNFGGSWFAE